MRRLAIHRAVVLSAVVAIVTICGMSTPAQAQEAESLFQDAVSAYQRGQFDSAAVGFQMKSPRVAIR